MMIATSNELPLPAVDEILSQAEMELLTPKELAAGPRPQRTSEMEVIGYSR